MCVFRAVSVIYMCVRAGVLVFLRSTLENDSC